MRLLFHYVLLIIGCVALVQASDFEYRLRGAGKLSKRAHEVEQVGQEVTAREVGPAGVAELQDRNNKKEGAGAGGNKFAAELAALTEKLGLAEAALKEAKKKKKKATTVTATVKQTVTNLHTVTAAGVAAQNQTVTAAAQNQTITAATSLLTTTITELASTITQTTTVMVTMPCSAASAAPVAGASTVAAPSNLATTTLSSAPTAAESLASAISLGSIGAATTAAPAAANNPAAAPNPLTTAPSAASAAAAAQPNLDTSGLTLKSVLSLGNLLTQTVAAP